MIFKAVQCVRCGRFQATRGLYKFSCKLCGKTNVLKRCKVVFVSNDAYDVAHVVAEMNEGL